MKRTLAISSIVVFGALILCSCELFVVGSAKRSTEIERSQRSSAGVVHLFKAELDSNNPTAATELMLHSSGRKMLAIEKFELGDELQRWQKQFKTKPITGTTVDTLDAQRHTVHITLDYIRHYDFNTILQDDEWFVTGVKLIPR